VRAGAGREAAHEAIKQQAVAVALAMRERPGQENDLLQRLAADPRLGLQLAQLQDALAAPLSFTGAAGRQTEAFVAQVEQLLRADPTARAYRPDPML
jgi:adenylosuccinate lyase